MQRILIVEDNLTLAKLISDYLISEGYLVNCESRGDKAVFRIQHENYFLVILDINLPEVNGLQICKLVRKNFSGYIIILTARESDEDHIHGLEIGADDYIKKPIKPKVLLARIQSLLRRKPSHPTSQQLQFGNLVINLENRQVTLADKQITLTPTEFDILFFLATNAGVLVTRDNIMRAIRGVDYDGIDRTIDLRISFLRSKLGDDSHKPFRIKTLRGKGYIFQPNAWG